MPEPGLEKRAQKAAKEEKDGGVVEMAMKRYRTIGGKDFRLDRSVLTKDSAKYRADQLRRQGRSARVVKAAKTETAEDGSRWHIFVR